MPNFKTHASAGAIAGALVSIYEYQQIKRNDPNAEFDFLQLLIDTLAGIAGASLPDKLEPAYHPNHRSTFHSFSAAALNVWGVSSTGNIEQLDLRLASATKAFFFGYLSHLALDLTTPKKSPNCLMKEDVGITKLIDTMVSLFNTCERVDYLGANIWR